MFRDYTYLSSHLGELTTKEPRRRTLQGVPKAIFVLARLVLIAGLVIGLPNLTSDSSQDESHPSHRFANALIQSPAVAKEASTPAPTTNGGLADWPDLFGEAPVAEQIQPTKANRTEAELAISSRKAKKIAPPTEDPFPTLHASLNGKPAVKRADTSSGGTSEGPKLRLASLPVQGKAGEIVPAKAPEELTPIATKSQIQSNSNPSPRTEVVQTSQPQMASESKTESSAKKKGFVIKVEGGGKELVVYDADGKEILRKSRKQPEAGTTISGSGKTLTNRTREKVEEKITSALAKTESKKEIPEPLQKEGPAATANLIFDEVKKGENLSLIASRYKGVTADDLMRANQIDDPHCIAAGTKIWVPQDGVDGICHKVDHDETLSSLLRTYEIADMFEVCELNGLNYYSTNQLEIGQMLVLPNAKRKNSTARTHVAKAIRSDLSKLKGNVRWQWPVEDDFKVSSRWGRRVDPFSRKSKTGSGGPKPRFSMHHGIDLAVPVGTPVHAARDGEVIEVSKSRYGHGNMIKIRHEDGWCTVYSHNSKLLKKEGDIVKQGDLIARSGNTGRSTGPHLHFEVRRPNQESVDPKNLLPSL